MRALLTAATLLATVAAQQRGAQQQPPAAGELAPVTQPTRPAPPPPPLDKTLAAVLAEIAANPHAYEGRLTWGPQQRADVPIDALDFPFSGGVTADPEGELRWHSLQQWTVLQRGERGATRHVGEAPEPARAGTVEDTGWQCPQGDAPEVPLTPRLLFEQLPKATISRPVPTEVDGRPAIRVLATWRGEARKAAMQLPAVPSSRHEQLLDILARIAPQNEHVSVCAEIRYDPAMRRWLAATLRILFVEPKPLPDDEPPLPAPEGMPAPTGRPQMELIVTLRRRDPKELPPPELDERARELLRARDR